MNKEFDGHLYQAVVFYKKEIKVKFHKEILSYPFYSNVVFQEPAEATKYLSTFIRDMVSNGDLPKDAIKDNKINEDLIIGAVQDIVIGKMELEDTNDAE